MKIMAAGNKTRLFAILALSVLLLGFAALFVIDRPATSSEPLPPPGGEAREGPVQPLAIVSADGTRHDFEVEIADTDEARARGLMFRHHMADTHGMLFLFDTSGIRAFWMKNTYIPLDILFIRADGTIHHIAANAAPLKLDAIPSGGVVRDVLELNGGAAARLGIREGDVVHLPAFGNVLAP
jgi:uncharacterized membrane protein (UPF0127 family)